MFSPGDKVKYVPNRREPCNDILCQYIRADKHTGIVQYVTKHGDVFAIFPAAELYSLSKRGFHFLPESLVSLCSNHISRRREAPLCPLTGVPLNQETR